MDEGYVRRTGDAPDRRLPELRSEGQFAVDRFRDSSRRPVARHDREIRSSGAFVRRTDARESSQLATTRGTVEAFRIARLANRKWSVDEHFVKGDSDVFVSEPCTATTGFERADESHEDDESGIGEQGRHFTGASYAFVAIRIAESEVRVETGSQAVAVEQINGTTGMRQPVVQLRGNRRLACSGQAGEPHCRTSAWSDTRGAARWHRVLRTQPGIRAVCHGGPTHFTRASLNDDLLPEGVPTPPRGSRLSIPGTVGRCSADIRRSRRRTPLRAPASRVCRSERQSR